MTDSPSGGDRGTGNGARGPNGARYGGFLMAMHASGNRKFAKHRISSRAANGVQFRDSQMVGRKSASALPVLLVSEHGSAACISRPLRHLGIPRHLRSTAVLGDSGRCELACRPLRICRDHTVPFGIGSGQHGPGACPRRPRYGPCRAPARCGWSWPSTWTINLPTRPGIGELYSQVFVLHLIIGSPRIPSHRQNPDANGIQPGNRPRRSHRHRAKAWGAVPRPPARGGPARATVRTVESRTCCISACRTTTSEVNTRGGQRIAASAVSRCVCAKSRT